LKDKILVLGVGNMLMRDEAIGIEVVKALDKNELPENVDVVDGGTGGFHLLSYLQEYKKIIFVDASLDDRPEGTVTMIEPKFSSDFPKSLSAHDIGLKDLIESASLLGELPKMYLVIISIKKFQNLSLEVSENIMNSIPKAADVIKNLIGKMSGTN
jgi:hydrogenase maturation protease